MYGMELEEAIVFTCALLQGRKKATTVMLERNVWVIDNIVILSHTFMVSRYFYKISIKI